MLEELGFKAVLKEKKVTLNEEEAAMLGNGFFAGHQMNSSSYYTWVKQARAKAYIDSGRSGLIGDDSYVVRWHWHTLGRRPPIRMPGQEKNRWVYWSV